MSRYSGNSQECPGCGVTYGDFRTGLTYREVRQMLWDYSPDPAEWTYKRRGTVLGNWFAIKQQLWARHVEECWNANVETTVGAGVPF